MRHSDRMGLSRREGLFDTRRNNYDRFVQGFVPAILVRELLVRLNPGGTAGGGSAMSGNRWRCRRILMV